MTDKELRELDVWIAENVFGIEVARDANGALYVRGGVIGGLVISWIRHYTKDSEAFSAIKREIERRGWDWGIGFSRSRPSPLRYDFLIYDSDKDYKDLGHVYAESEELAGCLALKDAVEGMAEL